MLSYKLNFRGKQLIIVDKWYASSQICNVCGYKNAEVQDMSIREWKCPSCGAEHDRDINAAKNICEEGKKLSTVGHTGIYACGDGVRRDELLLELVVQSSTKQEAPTS